MARKFFGTDGIRGRTNEAPMTAELAMRVGQAAGAHFLRGDHRHRVVIGKDTRLSGYMMESALVAGFTSVGMDVIQVGPLPTPAVAMLTKAMRADIGVMISASHNPYQDNGIKLFGPDGFKLSDEDEAAIEAMLDSRRGSRPPRASAARSGSRMRAAATSMRSRSSFPEASAARRAADRRRLRARRRLCRRADGFVGARRRPDHDRRQARWHQRQRRRRLDRARGAAEARCSRRAPISASRSTAMPIG